jgi:hypothetical protein
MRSFYLLLLVFSLNLSDLFGERITVKLKIGEDGVSCYELNAPRRWAVPPVDTSETSKKDVPYMVREYGNQLGSSSYVLRESSRLLLGVVATVEPDRAKKTLYSPDIYAIVPQKKKAILEPVDQREWDAARPLPQFHEHALGALERHYTNQPLLYDGRTFAPVGSRFETTFISEDKAHLALVSWNGSDYAGDVLAPRRIRGHFFIDLFHVPGGRRLARIEGTFHNLSPESFAGKSFWIDGPRFVLPLSSNMRRLFLCEIP